MKGSTQYQKCPDKRCPYCSANKTHRFARQAKLATTRRAAAQQRAKLTTAKWGYAA